MSQNPVKNLVLNALGASGLPRVYQRFFARGGASILMYHGIVREALAVPDWCFVSEADFNRQMDYLARYFEVIALADLPARLGTVSKKPLAAITFDDGYASNHEFAWPILKQLRLPATIFLNTALIGSDDTVWFCRLNDALARTPKSEVEWCGIKIPLATAYEKAEAGARLQEELKELPNGELKSACEDLIRDLGDDPSRPIAEDSPYRMLSPRQVNEMARDGLIDFGAHTRTHAIISKLSDERLREEIEGSIDEVEGLSGKPCRTFAYPNGRIIDYDARAMSVLRERGIVAAVTTMGGRNEKTTPPLELKRYGIGADMAWRDFKLEIHHVKSALRR